MLHADVRDVVIFGKKSDNETVFVVAAAIVVAKRSSHGGDRLDLMVE